MNNEKPRRYDAYYFSLNKTSSESVNKLLSAICFAGKGYHHTENWQNDLSDYGDYSGGSHIGWIQNSANELAQEIAKLEKRVAELELLTSDHDNA